ncbi:hypothetical protein A0U89_14890 (plasmid) [Kozakia baliensis]|uniref:Uncharacterized protein n=1 Tax=Kozakia baliensis TaxID=153496 RepID=A0A1D8UY80_9PROT|nr:hypothetical protein [Kozakia baliensis]AOX18572.1 hypothetical protein A0U89_14890 [Kozakia baliensis]
MPKRGRDDQDTKPEKPCEKRTYKPASQTLTPDQVVFAENGSPHKRDRCEPVFQSKESKHRRYYERNRELVRERQRIAHSKRRAAQAIASGQAEGGEVS